MHDHHLLFRSMKFRVEPTKYAILFVLLSRNCKCPDNPWEWINLPTMLQDPPSCCIGKLHQCSKSQLEMWLCCRIWWRGEKLRWPSNHVSIPPLDLGISWFFLPLIFVFMCGQVPLDAHVCMHGYTCAWVHGRTCVVASHLLTFVWIRLRVYLPKHAYNYMHAYANMHILTCTYMHVQSGACVHVGKFLRLHNSGCIEVNKGARMRKMLSSKDTCQICL